MDIKYKTSKLHQCERRKKSENMMHKKVRQTEITKYGRDDSEYHLLQLKMNQNPS